MSSESDNKKSRMVGIRVTADIYERLEALAKRHPVGTISSFAAECLRQGLPDVEAAYPITAPVPKSKTSSLMPGHGSPKAA
jgi:hypothetical protein